MDFITEASFRNYRGKADILVLDEAKVIEIMVSEKLNNVEWKSRKYPKVFEIVAVNSSEEYFSGNYSLVRQKQELI